MQHRRGVEVATTATAAAFIEHALHASCHFFQVFWQNGLVNYLNTPVKDSLLLSPFHKWENGDLPRIIAGRCWAKIHARVCQTPRSEFWTTRLGSIGTFAAQWAHFPKPKDP